MCVCECVFIVTDTVMRSGVLEHRYLREVDSWHVVLVVRPTPVKAYRDRRVASSKCWANPGRQTLLY